MNESKRRLAEGISTELESELAALMRDGRTIEAIKRLREATGASLAESKAWVDERWPNIAVTIRKAQTKPCPYCTMPLRSNFARQCFECGMDWHDPSKIEKRG